MAAYPHLWPPYAQLKTQAAPLPVVAAHGVHLELADGRRLVDAIASWWTAAHGYRHPHIVAAVQAQLHVLPHVMLGGLVHPQAERLAARLAAWCPGDLDHVFFSESGSVSVEVAMKAAVQSRIHEGQPGRTRFVGFRGGYHGDTLGTMAVCDPEEGMHTLFRGAITEQIVADLPTTPARRTAFEALLAEHGPTLAAVVVEPLVQGAGGMRFHDVDTLRFVRAATERHDVLLIADEIMTGLHRLGPRFACEAAGIVPDFLTLSKALTGGVLPLAATVVRRPVFETFWSDDPAHALMHGPTYSGNALGCAAANASLDLFEQEPRGAQAEAIERQLAAALAPLRDVPGVVDVRWRGALGVVQLDRPADRDRWVRHAVDRGVWLRPFGDVVYCAPPLVTPPDALAQVTRVMADGVWRRSRGTL